MFEATTTTTETKNERKLFLCRFARLVYINVSEKTQAYRLAINFDYRIKKYIPIRLTKFNFMHVIKYAENLILLKSAKMRKKKFL